MIKGIKVSKMEPAQHAGDWHDAPLRWEVKGPGAELQKFSTKADASKYATIRRRSENARAAENAYVRAY